jgi:hypothetical protein
MGANDGYFSQLLAERSDADVIAIDADAACINNLYNKHISNILPLCVDILHPSPALGFRNKERSSFNDRFRAELVVALALVHHLVLSGNVPVRDVAGHLAELSIHLLIIEFVPLEDEKAQELIRNKHRWHLPYDELSFEQIFLEYFTIVKKSRIPGTERILYMMKKHQS